MGATANDVLLEVRNLEIQYGAAIAVRGVDLIVRRGEFVSVIGNNGAGKTSILRGISGLVRPRAGSVLFKGEETANFPAYRKVSRGLAMVPEGRLIFADQTVEDNLILGAYGRWSCERDAALRDFATMFDLFPRLKERLHQRAGSLSGGEQQMLAVARGLVSKPDLLMIDEMSLGLAPKIVEQMMGVLRDLNSAGQTILLVEQLAAQALAISHRAYVVGHGKIELEGHADELADSPAVMEAFLGKKRQPDK
ncbi:MAG: ABC transporter ATP-binding protein [Pseudonocardiaceae bacterium]|uniref:ABC transporter ATP-binding protein n=1 Tax=Afipia sp. 1NLS2 TaxID=666684 RepID=UPI0001DA0D68|nr:ABC transporter ATP-binding protein [Afipia sp. 1NLS2]EFI52703.1 ABC transporter related protein [Afipia sp. 1NLS2]MBE0703442.1 ABC transporter ATP-binding protein [Afipia sp.]RTL65051.1 MAG: ABC transporter ATP-binding protein [Pseudonocardiaceae bacterium]